MTRKILIVDDEPDVLRVLSVRLKCFGYEPLASANAAEAFEKIREEKPDLVLMDILLPGMDGCEVCRQLKSDKALRHIPVLLITASILEENIGERMQSSGADDYLIKPFEPEILLKKIKRLTGEE